MSTPDIQRLMKLAGLIKEEEEFNPFEDFTTTLEQHKDFLLNLLAVAYAEKKVVNTTVTAMRRVNDPRKDNPESWDKDIVNICSGIIFRGEGEIEGYDIPAVLADIDETELKEFLFKLLNQNKDWVISYGEQLYNTRISYLKK